MGSNPAIRHLHLVEPAPNLGHGPLWLGYLIDALRPGVEQLTITYPNLEAYQQTVDRIPPMGHAVKLRPFDWRDNKREWEESLSGARELQADLTLFADLGLPLKRATMDLRTATASPIWGLWFNPPPRQHLSAWTRLLAVSHQSRKARREQQWLRRLPDWLSGVFVQDELLRERISPRAGLTIAVIPDPWPSRPEIEQAAARRQLGLPGDRRLFLHLGVAAPRKGLGDAITAWQGMRDRPDCMLLRAGSTDDRDRPGLDDLIRDGRAILHGGWISEERLDAYLRASDWILLPYRQHEGSSGLLAGAAAARRPVITADYGVLGRRVTSHQLGLVYPHGSVGGLEKAIRTAGDMTDNAFAAGLQDYSDSQDQQHLGHALRSSLRLREPNHPA